MTNEYRIVKAKFNPKITHNLKEINNIGDIGYFERMWIIDEGIYKGQYAMHIIRSDCQYIYGIQNEIKTFDNVKEWGWCPEEDLEILELIK